LHALNWLKKYNQIYKESVTIDESNLDWMDGAEEAELPSTDVIALEKEESLHSSFNDCGPAEAQCLPTMGCEDELDELKTCGIHVEDASPLMSQEDNELCDVIKIGTKSVPSLPWPYVSPDPVNEYDTTEKIFSKAFPWLFPGGVGDSNDAAPWRSSQRRSAYQMAADEEPDLFEYFDPLLSPHSYPEGIDPSHKPKDIQITEDREQPTHLYKRSTESVMGPTQVFNPTISPHAYSQGVPSTIVGDVEISTSK
jgi:hypothetical protein